MGDSTGRPATPAVTIVVPAYNERQCIRTVVNGLAEQYPGFEILVVDDGSTDDTVALLTDAKCRLVRHRRNRGYGASWKTGTLRARGEILVFYDGDGQFDPGDVQRLVDTLQQSDSHMVLGARDRRSHRPWLRRPGKRLLFALAAFLANQKIKDLNCGLRAVRRDLLKRYLHLLPDGFSASTTSTLVFLKRGYDVSYVDITSYKRVGRSSVNLMRDGFGTLLLILRIVCLFDPLRLFVPTALALMGAAVSYSAYEALTHGLGVPVLGATVFIGGVLVFFMGIVCDQISAMRLERFESPFQWPARLMSSDGKSMPPLR